MKKTAQSQHRGRLLIGQFCDDIRIEVGNKLTLVGCYGDEMLVPAFPITLPKIAVQAKAITPIEQPFEKLIFRLLIEGNLLGQIETSGESLSTTPEIEVGRASWLWLAAAMVVSPLVIHAPSEIVLIADTERGELVGSKLRVRLSAEIEKNSR